MEDIKTARRLKEYILENQLNVVYNKILKAAHEGLFKTSFQIDFMLSNSCLVYLREKGYTVKETYSIDRYNYYEIFWG